MGRSPLLCLVLATSACGFHAAASPDAGTGNPDAPTDPDATDAPPADGSGFCLGMGSFTVCLPSEPTGNYNVSTDTLFDTDSDCTSTQAIAGGPTLCIKSA